MRLKWNHYQGWASIITKTLYTVDFHRRNSFITNSTTFHLTVSEFALESETITQLLKYVVDKYFNNQLMGVSVTDLA